MPAKPRHSHLQSETADAIENRCHNYRDRRLKQISHLVCYTSSCTFMLALVLS